MRKNGEDQGNGGASNETQPTDNWLTKVRMRLNSWVGNAYSTIAVGRNTSNVELGIDISMSKIPTKDMLMNTTSASIHQSDRPNYKRLDAVVKRISLGLEYCQYLFVAAGGLAAAGGVVAHSLNANTIVGSMVGGAFGFAFWLSHPKP